MSTKNSIHDFDVNLIVEYFTNTERQGCGSPDVTRKAFSFIEHLPNEAHIVDLGSGGGGQTMELAKVFGGKITGIDLFPSFVELFNRNAEKHKVQHWVKAEVGSMDALTFAEGSLDVVWCEGAIYNIGFEKGLQLWHRYLKDDGYVVVSEATWFKEDRPAEVEAFWMDAYPGIDTVQNKIAQLQKAGYAFVASFALPEECWTKYFWDTQVKVREDFLKKYAGNKFAEGFVENQRYEEQLYHRFKQYYGYSFFIGKKIG